MFPKDVDNKLISFQKYVIGLRKQKKYLLSHIGNMDSTPVTFDMIGNKTMNMKGTKAIHIKTTGHEKSPFTVVTSCLADGTKLKPMVIFKRKTVPKSNFPKGDLRQLPPVRSTPIYKQPKQTIVGPILLRNLKFYERNEVMRQANQQFSSILTKIGNREELDEIKITLIVSRFCTVEEAELRCPQDIRLFNTNNSFRQ
ncbi:HTH CENPB-type domain-containing protein [Trichonephila clavipes]|nr:HTH CENPB-type domain-containing protein [Trichonephila clavipes]